MNKERDKFLTEYLGYKWHETKFREYDLTIDGCSGTFIEKTCTCGRHLSLGKKYNESDTSSLCVNANINFSTWNGFGLLFEYCKKQSYWEDFVDLHDDNSYDFDLINPNEFANAVYNYLKEQ